MCLSITDELTTMSDAELTHKALEAQALLAAGWKQVSVARHLGLTPPTLTRLLARARTVGAENVGPRYAVGPRDSHELTAGEVAAIKLGMLEKRSRKYAAEALMNNTACTDATFEKLAAVFDSAADKRDDEIWPTWFKRACILTEEEKASFLGPKALARVESARPRGLFYEEVKEDGSRIQHPLFANAIWEFDDESENTPWVELDANGKPRVNRQTLKAIDVYASFYLGMRAVSREKDSYRVEDQADFLGELVDAHGMPMRVRIERGPWDNRFWFGTPLPKAWRQTLECGGYLWGGIDTRSGGPIGVMQAFKSRHKGTIEGSFHHRQTLAAHETIDIGRERGEHEGAARDLRRARTGQADAVAKFPEAAVRADISLEVMERFNHEAKRRKHLFGSRKVVPAELYASAVRREMPAGERWRLLPVKVAVTVRNSQVQIKAPHHDLPFVFTAEGFQPLWDWHKYLPFGWRCFAAFHPQRPELGCRIFNAAHPDSEMNPARFPLGMPLGVLPMAERAAQFVIGGAADFAARKATAAEIRMETRITRAAKKGARVSQVVARGQTRSVRAGSPDPLHAVNSDLVDTLPQGLGYPTVQEHLDHGSPKVVGEVIISSGAGRGGLGQAAGSGEGSGRAARDHEARHNSAGQRRGIQSEAAELARLEAMNAEEDWA